MLNIELKMLRQNIEQNVQYVPHWLKLRVN